MKNSVEEKISIIVPTYKRPHMIEKTINSLLKQTYKNIEIIIVDDNVVGSKEHIQTYEVIEKYKDIKNIKYIKNEFNLGACESRNQGIQRSEGEYISFLDDDDEYYENKIYEQYKFYKKNFPKNDGFINCNLKVYNNGKYYRTHRTVINSEEIFFEALNEKILGTPTLFIPKILLEDINGFKKIKKGQEWYLILRLILKGYKFKNLNKVLVKVHEHDEERISNGNYDLKRSIDGLDGIYEIQKKYFSKLNENQKKIIQKKFLLKKALVYSKFNLKKEKIKNIKNVIEIGNLNSSDIKEIFRILFVSKRLEQLLKKNKNNLF